MTSVKRHAVLVYFALVFLFSWGSGLLVLGPGGFPLDADRFASLGPLVYAAMLIGPALGGVLMIAIVDGRRGLRELVERLVHWRAAPGIYALALLPALAMTTVTLLLSLVSPSLAPDLLHSNTRTAIVLSALVPSILFGFFEEIGWTGFAVPQLRARHSVLTTGLVVGVVWGAWHLPLFWEDDTLAAALPLAILFARLFAWLPPLRVLLVRIHERSGSLPVVMLAHAAVSFVSIVLAPKSLAGVYLLASPLVAGATMWLLLAAVGTTDSGPLPDRPSRLESVRHLTPS